MSKSFNVKVTFNFRATVSDADIEALLKGAENYRAGKGREKNHKAEVFIKALDEGGTDGLLAAITKEQVRDMRALILEEAAGGDMSRFSPFHVEITPRG